MLLSPSDDHIQRVLSYWGQFEAELARMSVFIGIVASAWHTMLENVSGPRCSWLLSDR